MPETLDLAPARAAGASHIDRPDAGLDQPPGRLGADPIADLLGDHRDADVRAHVLDAFEQPFEVRVAFRLHRLLKGVEVQDQGVGLDHLDRAPTLVYAVPVVQLHRAEVRQQRDVRRNSTDLVGVGQPLVANGRPLRTNAHCQAKRFGSLGQRQVDAGNIVGSAGHRTDQQGGAHRLAKERCRRIDFGQIKLRQRFVRHAVGGKARVHPFRCDVLAQDDANVVAFAAGSQVVVGHRDRSFEDIAPGNAAYCWIIPISLASVKYSPRLRLRS